MRTFHEHSALTVLFSVQIHARAQLIKFLGPYQNWAWLFWHAETAFFHSFELVTIFTTGFLARFIIIFIYIKWFYPIMRYEINEIQI